MAGGSSKSNPTRIRKRVEAADGGSTLKRARDGSAFVKCEACNKNVPVVLVDMHDCGLDSKIRMSLEAQVVEKEAEVKKPAAKKRAAPSTDKKEKKVKREKKSKDPNMPKRPPTAFFVFMDEFRKTFKEANPDNKSVAVVAKEGGEKWKSLTDEERKTYIERAAELKAEYEKTVKELEQENAEEENESSSKEEDNAGEDENAEGNADNKDNPNEDEDEC